MPLYAHPPNAPDPDDQPTEAIPTTATALQGHRVERFRELGFSEASAELLACAKDARGFHVYWGDVARSLENGATHDQMVAIHA